MNDLEIIDHNYVLEIMDQKIINREINVELKVICTTIYKRI